MQRLAGTQRIVTPHQVLRVVVQCRRRIRPVIQSEIPAQVIVGSPREADAPADSCERFVEIGMREGEPRHFITIIARHAATPGIRQASARQRADRGEIIRLNPVCLRKAIEHRPQGRHTQLRRGRGSIDPDPEIGAEHPVALTAVMPAQVEILAIGRHPGRPD